MGWVHLKDTPLVRMLVKLADLHMLATELVIKQRLNGMRTRLATISASNQQKKSTLAARQRTAEVKDV